MEDEDKKAFHKYALAYNLKKQHSLEDLSLINREKRYVIYARRSTTDEARQQESIPAQVEKCEEFAKRNNLQVVNIIREEKSAKKAGRRDKFTEMLKEIKEGHTYNSILAWHPDRLARNMKESGEIMDMIDSGILADLKFVSFTFNNDSAGFYCYGNMVVDLVEADPKFIPQVSYKDFLSVQNLKKDRVTYHNTEDFLPFRDLVKCADCNCYMIPGRSTSKSKQRYLYVTCSNTECRKKNRQKNEKTSSIRGKVLVDSAIEFLSSNLDINKDLYNDTIREIRKSKASEINELEKTLSTTKANKTKYDKVELSLEKMLFEDETSELLAKKMKDILAKIDKCINEINELEESIAEKEIDLELELPSYDRFVNFFENAVTVLKNTEDPELIDRIVKLVFLNIYVGGKKVLAYDLQEPFSSYVKLKFLHGVEDGT